MRKLLLFVLVLNGRIAFAADTAPDWVMEQSTRPLPAYSNEVGAVTLFDEGRITVAPDGTIQRTLRYAVRILNVEGRKDTLPPFPIFNTSPRSRSFAPGWSPPAAR